VQSLANSLVVRNPDHFLCWKDARTTFPLSRRGKLYGDVRLGADAPGLLFLLQSSLTPAPINQIKGVVCISENNAD